MIRRGLILLSLAFAITLAIVLGTRISADALAVIIGVVLGIAASIPTTLVVIFAMTRHQSKADRMVQQAQQHPPIVIVNGTDKPQGYPSQPALPPGYPSNGARKWTVIGDEELDG